MVTMCALYTFIHSVDIYKCKQNIIKRSYTMTIKVTTTSKDDKNFTSVFSNGDNEYMLTFSAMHPSFYIMLLNAEKAEKYGNDNEKKAKYFLKFIENFENLLGDDVFIELSNFYRENNEELDLMELFSVVMEGMQDEAEKEESTEKK